jgi:hypothetical protein
MRWEVDNRQPNGLGALLRWTSPQLLELFPFEHQLRVEIQIDSGELTIATTLYATGEDSVPVCLATTRICASRKLLGERGGSPWVRSGASFWTST